MGSVKVSVIVPVYRDPRILQCLEAIERQTYPRDLIEVIVVENIERQSVSLSGVVRLFEPRRGSYAARNLGASVATGQILAFTDADCLPAPEWIARAVALFQADPDVDALGGDVILTPADPHRVTAAELYELVWGFPQQEFVVNKHFAATANLLVRRSVFDEVGPFRADMMSGGDQEWGERSASFGKNIRFAPEVAVSHPARHRLGDLLIKYVRTCGGQYQLRRLYGQSHWPALVKLLRKMVCALAAVDGRLSWWDQIRYVSVQWVLSAAQLIEIARLACGGSPRSR